MLLILSIALVFAQEIVYERVEFGQTETSRPLIVEQFGDGEKVFAILSSIHGTEDAGTPLSIALASHLQRQVHLLEGKTILLVHLTNPDGFVAELRGNRNNVDINRNFPTQNFGRGIFNGQEPLSASETKELLQFLHFYRPERILVMHQPLNCIDYDGNSESLARHLSTVSGIRIKRLGSRSGSLGTYVGIQLQKEIITLELPSYASEKSSEWLWDKYGDLLIAFLVFPLEK